MNLNEIYEKAKLTELEIESVPDFIAGNQDFYDSSTFEKLYEYFAFETGEMPYLVAKARTECPDVWILERLEDLGESIPESV